jgi:dephospho-CoA kinase
MKASNNTTCLRVGITGGIGSGKTTVCHLFEALGVPVYYADYWAKWLTTNDTAVKNAIMELFGAAAYLPDGTYHRAEVARQVFSDKEKLARLNAILHPAVEQHGQSWHRDRAAEGHAYTLKEAALMIESGSYKHLDQLIVVTAPEMLRIQRVMQRDGLTEAEVRQRMSHQLPESEKIKLADRLIHNDGSESLIQQVWSLHRSLIGSGL